MTKRVEITREELYRLYWEEGLSIRKIAKKLGVGKSTIEYWLKKYKISRRPPKENNKLKNLTKDELYDLYWNRGLSIGEIAKMFGVGKSAIRSKMLKLGIARRNNSKEPCLTPSPTLAYVLGVILGDGSVSVISSCRAYRVELRTVDEVFARSFCNALKGLGLNPKMYCQKRKERGLTDIYYVCAHSKVFVEWYRNLTSNDIKRIAFLYPKEFIRGFYESEGYIHKYGGSHKDSYEAGMTNTVEWIVDLIARLLEYMGFHPHVYKYRCNYVKTELYCKVIICRRDEVYHFLKLIKPCIKNRPIKG